MKMDEYREVINHPDTYKDIAKALKEMPVLIGWTDEHSSHFDILFTYGVNAALAQVLNGSLVTSKDVVTGEESSHFLSGSFQGGIRPSDLFVSVMRVGSFGFEVNENDTDWGYYQEKLARGSSFFGETTGKKLAELINGVRKELYASK